jgi:deoxyribodipyrimidine photolyase-related protein
MSGQAGCRHLVLVLGDQLNRNSAVFDGFDPAQDRVWMCEALEESTHVTSSLPRTVMFLAAMRHFAAELRREGLPLDYVTLRAGSLARALTEALARHHPQRLLLVQPGEWRLRQALRAAAGPTPLEEREDRHFMASAADFAAHVRGRRQWRMEYFYR